MLNSSKQVNAVLGNLKKRLNRMSNSVKEDYLNGTLDTTLTIDDKEIKLSDKLVELLVLSRGMTELLEKNVVNLHKLDTGKVTSHITSLMDGIHKVYNNDVSSIKYFDLFPGEQMVMMVDLLDIKLEELIGTVSIEMMYYGFNQIKPNSKLTDSYLFNGLIWLYILIKNGYIDELADNKMVKEGLNLPDTLTEGCPFEYFCYYLETIGVNDNIFKLYIKTYFDGEVTNEKIKEFYIELNKEMKASNDADERQNLIEEKRKKNSERQDVQLLKRQGVEIVDILIYYETEADSEIYEGILGILHSLFNIKTELTGKYMKSACSNLGKTLELCIQMIACSLEDLVAETEKDKEKSEKQLNELTKIKEMLKTYKAKLKQTERDLQETKLRLSTQKTKNEKQIAYIETLKNQGITNIKPYTDEIEKLKLEVEAKNTELATSKRAHSKLQQSFQDLRSSYESVVKRSSELEAQVEKLQDKLSTAITYSNGSNIPLECYIRAIRNKKIALFGGNMMHSELKNLGFRNLKLFEASNRNMSFSDLSHQDLIVVVTGYMSHSTVQIPKGAAERYNIPIYYYNNKNVQMLIQEMFAIFYSENYKSLKEMKKNS